MGRRSRYLRHRRSFLPEARRLFESPSDQYNPLSPASWEGWYYYKQWFLWERREEISSTFRDRTHVRQAATRKPNSWGGLNRATRRRLKKHQGEKRAAH